MKIEIQREESSVPLVYDNVVNAFTKGGLYCVLFVDSKNRRMVHKFPLASLFRIVEDYPESKR